MQRYSLYPEGIVCQDIMPGVFLQYLRDTGKIELTRGLISIL
jgi:hypothetical protein